MAVRMVFLFNNPVFEKMPFPDWEAIYMPGTARAVIEAARDKIHLGYLLTHHPLYGNFRPKHQPFRSILLQAPLVSLNIGEVPVVDYMSLHLIEEALAVYRADSGISPEDASPVLCRDCSRLDFELMKTPLRQAGWSGAECHDAYPAILQ